jgi:microcystin-dependent protein
MTMSSNTRLTATALAAALTLSAAAWSPSAAACAGTEPLLASVCIFAGNFAPQGFAFTNGQIMAISQNTALFSLLGTTYGGNGVNTFALPDTRGRVIVGPGQGPGLSNYELGQMGGAETVSLTLAQLPAHSHSANTTVNVSATAYGQSAVGNSDGPGANSWAAKPRAGQYSSAAPNVSMSAGSILASATASTVVGSAGGGQPVDVRQPYLALNYVIAIYGVFPARQW